MQFTTEFWVQIVVYAVTFAAAWGSMNIRIRYLEEKVDKHNQMVERMAAVEQSVKSAHHRVNEIKEEWEHERMV
ncbi:MAG: hypothetical protein ACOX7F_06560 [Eubacteriales bacterium]|jgi:hypothetical protein